MTESPNYYAIITAEVRYCKDLPPNAKLLYGEITALANKEGYCWAGNEYFANLYDVHKSTISSWVSKLAKLGFIRLEIVKKGDQMERKIFVKTLGGVSEKTDTPTRKDEHNTTLNNTKNKSKSHCSASGVTPKVPQPIKAETYKIFEDLVQNEQSFSREEYPIDYSRSRKHTKNLLNKYSVDELIHLWNSFCKLRIKDKFYKKQPLLITSLTIALIPHILVQYPFPQKELSDIERLKKLEDSL